MEAELYDQPSPYFFRQRRKKRPGQALPRRRSGAWRRREVFWFTPFLTKFLLLTKFPLLTFSLYEVLFRPCLLDILHLCIPQLRACLLKFPWPKFYRPRRVDILPNASSTGGLAYYTNPRVDILPSS